MRTPAKLIAIVAAGGALAVGVPVALATNDPAPAGNAAGLTQPVQQEEAAPPDRPDREDCPDKAGRDGSANQGDSAPDATATPDV